MFELLLSVASLDIMVLGLHQAPGVSLASYASVGSRQDLLMRCRFAVDRMAMSASESDDIFVPALTATRETLEFSERLLDTYDNCALTCAADGDAYLDADGNLYIADKANNRLMFREAACVILRKPAVLDWHHYCLK